MEGVFVYFIAIGSGLALGIVIVALPALALIKRMNKPGPGGKRNGY